ncbi:hypothetical protein F4802DRAFT_230828 [Xylaria palmicola]|nr:hypothetical protein F4802DRAFT_230828 [Xylaria palmicola]
MDTDSLPAVAKPPPPPSVFDSFSWLDEDDDLDLRLALNDFNADLKPSSPVTTTGPPSLFRRRLSVNKLSFNRPSVSSSRPGTKDSSFTEQAPVQVHARRKSRALSLITPKHGPQPSVASIDLAATHYQDPEARHKLRTYLASPQNFDEALEFGFPTSNTNSPAVLRGGPRTSRSFSQDLFMASSEKLKTFLVDDRSSIYSQETSLPDSDSPRTPHTPDNLAHNIKPFYLPSHNTALPAKPPQGSGHGPAVYREMTLRMTLTRPDLRSREEEPSCRPNGPASRKPSSSRSRPQSRPFRVDSPVLASDKDSTRENMDQIFADIDRELSSCSEGMVKRFWNRVRRG